MRRMKKKQEETYGAVAEAIREVNSRRTFRNLGAPERVELDRAALLLEKLSWKAVSDDISGMSARLKEASKDLKTLAGRISRRYKRLKSVAAVLRKAAVAAGSAAGVAEKVM